MSIAHQEKRQSKPKRAQAGSGRVRHKHDYPCTCAMGHLYRFVEPVLLLMLEIKGRSYGYQLCSDLSHYAFTDAEIERAALYRTLRRLEANGYVFSDWDRDHAGPARRVYSLTRQGEQHLRDWAQVLTTIDYSMSRFLRHVNACSTGSQARPRPCKGSKKCHMPATATQKPVRNGSDEDPAGLLGRAGA